jgi:hypothetical protein
MLVLCASSAMAQQPAQKPAPAPFDDEDSPGLSEWNYKRYLERADWHRMRERTQREHVQQTATRAGLWYVYDKVQDDREVVMCGINAYKNAPGARIIFSSFARPTPGWDESRTSKLVISISHDSIKSSDRAIFLIDGIPYELQPTDSTNGRFWGEIRWENVKIMARAKTIVAQCGPLAQYVFTRADIDKIHSWYRVIIEHYEFKKD